MKPDQATGKKIVIEILEKGPIKQTLLVQNFARRIGHKLSGSLNHPTQLPVLRNSLDELMLGKQIEKRRVGNKMMYGLLGTLQNLKETKKEASPKRGFKPKQIARRSHQAFGRIEQIEELMVLMGRGMSAVLDELKESRSRGERFIALENEVSALKEELSSQDENVAKTHKELLRALDRVEKTKTRS